MKGRYSKGSFLNLLLKKSIIPVLVAIMAHCLIYGAFVKYKMPFFHSNDSLLYLELKNELNQIDMNTGFDTDRINDLFELYYPNGWDYGHTGLEKTALIIDCDTKEILVSNDFTLPENELLREYKSNSESYLNRINQIERICDPAFGNLEEKSIIGYNNYNLSDVFYIGGRGVRLMTVMRVRFYSYFLKYLLPADIVLAVCSIAAALVLAFQKNTKNIQDDYRRSIINSLSHDLKTPLTIISGSAESLKENVNPEKREFYENAIIENVRYTESIINDALELSRTEKGVLKPVFEKCEISEIIREVCKKYEYLLSEKGISINISGTAVLKCDRRLFSQMLENIISNAVKYSDQAGSVDISLNRNCITVSNTFSGRIDTDIKKLTEPFTRGTKERSGRNGSGLGLAIAKNIADIHRYKICIDVKDKRFFVKIDF